MANGGAKKHRVTVTLELSTQSASALAAIMCRNSCMTLSETLEEALLFQHAVQTIIAAGGEVAIREENGDEFILESDEPDPRLFA